MLHLESPDQNPGWGLHVLHFQGWSQWLDYPMIRYDSWLCCKSFCISGKQTLSQYNTTSGVNATQPVYQHAPCSVPWLDGRNSCWRLSPSQQDPHRSFQNKSPLLWAKKRKTQMFCFLLDSLVLVSIRNQHGRSPQSKHHAKSSERRHSQPQLLSYDCWVRCGLILFSVGNWNGIFARRARYSWTFAGSIIWPCLFCGWGFSIKMETV